MVREILRYLREAVREEGCGQVTEPRDRRRIATVRVRVETAQPGAAPPQPRRGPTITEAEIPVIGLSRVAFPARRRPEQHEAEPPRPERTFMTMVDYLVGSDDLARTFALSRVTRVGRGVILVLTGLQEMILKYMEETSPGHYVISLRRVFEEEGERGVRRLASLLQAYDVLNWALRASPGVNNLITTLALNMSRRWERPRSSRSKRGGGPWGPP
jgi:hypothetical protein